MTKDLVITPPKDYCSMLVFEQVENGSIGASMMVGKIWEQSKANYISGADNPVCIKTMCHTNFLCDHSINLSNDK